MKNDLKKLVPGVVVLMAVSVSLSFLGGPVYPQSKYPLTSLLHCTRDQAILQAFDKMPGTRGEQALDMIVKQPVRVFFKDMREIDKRLKHYDALSWLSAEGQQVIFINKKHQGAPPEALAAIISHEVIHNDAANSVQEEIAGWRQEAILWREMQQRNPGLASIPKGQYPLVDRLNELTAADQAGTLTEMVRSNPGYKGLPETSPGFTPGDGMQAMQ